jgi:diaminohydroxyphosphoribosylaminopyrimidine deaminase/5-amino-6-(5-phosphoribosylamino)uracil reductase
MNWSIDDYTYMNHALTLAQRGRYSTYPNPQVGCVLVKDNAIISEGWHEVAGGPHAEINAIKQATGSTQDATAYVTLEPCCHQGKTGPCSKAIIDAGITRTVVAMQDPNPAVSGKGLSELIDAGIDVSIGLYETQAKQINAGFVKRMSSGLPYVRCKLAMSVDARIALSNGESQWITGEASRKDVHKLRAMSSVVMTGINTVIHDDPSLTVRDVEGLRRQPLRVVIDRGLKCPPDAKILQLDGRTVIYTLTVDEQRQTAITQAGGEVIVLSCHADIFLECVLKHLAEQEQVNDVLLESGPSLAGAFFDAKLIDELIIYEAPVLLGNSAKGLIELKELKSLTEKNQLVLLDSRKIDQDSRRIFAVQAGR